MTAVPPNIDSMEPGPVLAAFLSSVDVFALGWDDRVAVLRAFDRMRSHYEAQRLRAVSGVVDAYVRLEGLDAHDAPDAASGELQAALALTRRSADVEVELAMALRERLPAVWEWLEQGRIDARRAKVIHTTTEHLDPDTARAVVDRLEGSVERLTTSQLAARLRRYCLDHHPGDAQDRYEHAVDQRRITIYPYPDGTAGINATNLPPDRACQAMDHIDTLAKEMRTDGETRTMDQLRADIALALLNGEHLTTSGRQSSGVIELRTDLETLAGLAHHAGEINGFGPVIADIARKIADDSHDAEWRWTITDTETDQPLVTGTTRRRPDVRRRLPSAQQRRAVQVRDLTCVFMGCRMPATDCDVDHTVAYEDGGPTTIENTAALCRYHHHRMKHRGGWRYRRLRTGAYEWRSPLGPAYINTEPERQVIVAPP